MITMSKKFEDPGIDLDNFSKEEEIAKFSDMEPLGWRVIVRLYTEPQKKNGLYMPDIVHDDQQYKGCVGLVIAKSKAAYLDSRYEQTGPWCEVGDWVNFPSYCGYTIFYEGIPIFVLKEDRVAARVNDPRKITK